MSTGRAAVAAAAMALLGSLATTGCTDPYASQATSTVAGEQPAPAIRNGVGHATTLPTPEAVVRRAASLTGTWTATTVTDHYNLLARMSIGEARTDARTTAARLPTDRRLTASGSASTATVEAIARQGSERQRRARDGHRLVIVTRERLTADATITVRYRVTLATVVVRRDGWVLSRWEPQP